MLRVQQEQQSCEERTVQHDEESQKDVQTDQPDVNNNDLAEQKLLRTEAVQPNHVPVPAPARPPNQYDFSKEHQYKAKIVVSRIFTASP